MPTVAEDVARWERLDGFRRANWDTDYLDLGNYCLPTRAMGINLTVPGARITTKILDSEGFTAPTLLGASLHGNLSNPSTRWFGFEMSPPELNEDNDVQDWCEDTARRVDRMFTASNFHNELGECYLEAPVMGTAALIMEEELPLVPGGAPIPLFTALTIGTYAIAENAKGRVDSLFYKVEMSVRAAVGQFGLSNCGENIQQLYENESKRDDVISLLHAIYPRSESERQPGSRTKRNKPFVSRWINPKDKHALREGGYEEFPGAVWRWRKQGGEVYGRGQGHLALPDIKQLNYMTQMKNAGVALDVAPPLFELDRMVVGDLAWEPFARNVVRDKNAVFTIPSGARYDVTKLMEDRLETKIRKIFFVDQILALPPATQPSYMTAFEVAKRVEQEFKLLGPAYGRSTTELHGPLIERGARMLGRAGDLRPLPPAVAAFPNAEMHIKYLGPMARAQEAETLVGIAQKNIWLQGQLAMTPNDTSLLDNFDRDAEAMVVSRGYGVPASVTRGKDAIAKIREARAQAAEQQAKMAAMAQMAESAGKAAPMAKVMQEGAQAPQGAA